MAIAAFCNFYAILGVNNNMILHMQNLQGPREIGALIALPLFIAGLVGKLLSGWLTDLYGRKPVWLVSLSRIPLVCDVPSPTRPPPGCHFHKRCPIVKKGLCDVDEPDLNAARDSSRHWVPCDLRG